MHGPRPARAGFTLLEVLIAMVVLAVGLLGYVHLNLASVRASALSQELSEAVTHAGTAMERIMTQPYADTVSDVDPDNPHYGRYLVSWTVQNNTAVDFTKIITVSVTWNGTGGRHNFSAQLIKSRIY